MCSRIHFLLSAFLASQCLLLSVTAINHNTDNQVEGDNGVNGLRRTAATPWGEACGNFGTCMKKHECLAAGGILDGKCGALGHCCTSGAQELTTARLKRTNLSRPKTLSSPISYFIEARSNLVCQLRIDFERFVLSEPSLQDNHPQCWADAFQVDDIKLCGINTGQHIYVPFNASMGAKSKELRITLANRGINPSLVDPDWKIHVTQLECPNSAKRVVLRRLGRSMVPISDDDDDDVDAREPRTGHGTTDENIPASDAFWVAPAGCLQYYPYPSGVIESFNFNNGNGVYMGNMKYSICFRKTNSNQQLILTANTFALGSSDVTQTNEGYDDLCYTNIVSPGRSEDYLFIPEATRQSFPNVRATRFCARSIDGVTVISNMPGPFAIHFNSDTYYDNNRTESGFRLTYQIS